MNAKELKGLSRSDLLELLIAQTERTEQLERELAEAKGRAEARDIMISKSGTLAEAAMQINEVWKAADQAAAQYLSNVMRLYDEQLEKNAKLEQEYAQRSQELLGETTQKCQQLEQETQARCDEMLRKAQEESKAYWDQVYGQLEQYCAAHDNLSALLQMKG